MRRILVVGLGSIGRRHLANVRALLPGATVVVWRRGDDGSGVPPGADRVVFDRAAALASRPELALICTPATLHAAAGGALAAAGAHLFVEKPLTASVEDARALVAAAAAAGRTLAVGYHLRFRPSLAALRGAVRDGAIGRVVALRAEAGQYLPDWRPETDYRSGPSARAALGGGALLELSHELDLVRWIGGDVDDVAAVTARRGDLEIDVEDTAELQLRFASGALGSVHLDLLQRVAHRSLRVLGTAGTLLWDGIAGTTSLQRPGESVQLGAEDGERNAAYLAELRDVLAAVDERRAPAVSGDDGLRAVELVAAARRAAAERRTVALAPAVVGA